MLRPKRSTRLTLKATEIASNALRVSQIVDSKVQKQRELHVLQPIPAEQVAEPAVLDQPLPTYQPPLQLHYFNSRPRVHPQSPLAAFQLFITHEIVDIIVANTNSYAENHREAKTPSEIRSRLWHPTTNPEIWRYLGCLFYMGLHIEKERAGYWKDSHQLGRYIGRERFEQIHRYFIIRDTSIYPRKAGENFT
jgi:Transposase IS4